MLFVNTAYIIFKKIILPFVFVSCMLRNRNDCQCVSKEVYIIFFDMLRLEIGTEILTDDLKCLVLITQMSSKLSAVFGSLLFLDDQKDNGEQDEVEWTMFCSLDFSVS